MVTNPVPVLSISFQSINEDSSVLVLILFLCVYIYICAFVNVYTYVVICHNEIFLIVFTELIRLMYRIYIIELENKNFLPNTFLSLSFTVIMNEK